MVDDLSSEKTAILAIYSTRRDAEMAQDRLDEEGIQAFITADDAGGMYPQLQQPHGVKLVVLNRAAQHAQEVLDDAGLLPHHHEPMPPHEVQDDSRAFSTGRSVAIAAAIIFLLLLILNMLGL
jgi:hypothetical protein